MLCSVTTKKNRQHEATMNLRNDRDRKACCSMGESGILSDTRVGENIIDFGTLPDVQETMASICASENGVWQHLYNQYFRPHSCTINVESEHATKMNDRSAEGVTDMFGSKLSGKGRTSNRVTGSNSCCRTSSKNSIRPSSFSAIDQAVGLAVVAS